MVSFTQIGLQIGSERNSISYTDPVSNPHLQVDDYFSFQGGLHYWFKLKDIRIEFLPGVYYSYGQGMLKRNTELEKVDFTEQGIRFQFPVLLYPLQLLDDCNCPTFSKQGTFFEDGLHIFVEPGLQYTTRSNDEKSSKMVFYTKLGLGLDIGLNKWNTLSPQISYGYFFKDPIVEQLSVKGSTEIPASRHSVLGFALRYLFRWDYRRR